MRAPAEEQVGSTGATLVKAAFERLGWGVAVNPEHDLGTDLFVMARDERRFDLGPGGDQVNDLLLAAALTANYLGDHGAWRQLYALLGQDRLVQLDRNSHPADARAGLDRLRRAGDDNAIKLAVRQLAVDGPATAITLAAADIDLNQSTHTTGKTNLLLMQHGGDLLDPATAERTVGWLLATLRGPTTFPSRTTPGPPRRVWRLLCLRTCL